MRALRAAPGAPQDDTFLPMLSAWESLNIYIQLSLPVKLSKADRFARMDTVMEAMGLLRSKHTKVGCFLRHLLAHVQAQEG